MNQYDSSFGWNIQTVHAQHQLNTKHFKKSGYFLFESFFNNLSLNHLDLILMAWVHTKIR